MKLKSDAQVLVETLREIAEKEREDATAAAIEAAKEKVVLAAYAPYRHDGLDGEDGELPDAFRELRALGWEPGE